MLELRNLIQILAVSREWSAAVRSMAPIHASVERGRRGWRKPFRLLDPIATAVASPRRRHSHHAPRLDSAQQRIRGEVASAGNSTADVAKMGGRSEG